MSSLTDPVSHSRDNSVGGHPTTAQLENTAALLDQRKLAQAHVRAAATDGHDAGHAEVELTRATEQLLRALAEFPPVIRRLHQDSDRDVIADLASREPVHPTSDAVDVARRVADDRRVFVLEHPLLPGQLLNVVWSALTTNVPRRIYEVIGASLPVIDPQLADTAVFYSIWNADPAVAGLDTAGQLISGAVMELQAEFPHLETFITLSPVPGFRTWFEATSTEAGSTEAGSPEATANDDANDTTNGALDTPENVVEKCLQYLCTFDDRGRLLDPVARFHLGNGARLYFITADADRSERGAARSYGVMVNYRYEPEDRAANRAELQSGSVPLGPDLHPLD